MRLIVFSLLIKGMLMISTSNVVAGGVSQQDSIKQTIKQYVMGAQTRDLDQMNQAFHKDFRVTALLPGKAMNLDKATYLKLMSDQKIGGNKRSFEITDLISQSKNLAVARVVITEKEKVFYDNLTLIYADKRWQILNNATETKTRK